MTLKGSSASTWCHHMRRVEERVARFQFGDLRGSECLAQSREALEVRRVDVRHGHDLAAWRRLEGAWIEILDLLRAETT